MNTSLKNAAKALKVYISAADPNDEIEEHVIDLLADIQHYCDTFGIDFNNCLRIARDHFNTEKKKYEKRAYT